MFDSIRMIEKLIISKPLDAQPASILRVIRVARNLCDLSVFLVDHDATPRHATLTNRPDDLLFHVFPPGFNELWSSYSFSSGFSIQLETSIIRNRHPELVDSRSFITSCQDLWVIGNERC
jgi:hypothetical protein